MGTTKDKPVLYRSVDEKPIVEEVLPISPRGAGLVLSMPKGCELDRAKLSLGIGDETDKELSCDFTDEKETDLETVSWLIADWHCKRPVIALEVKLEPKTEKKIKARIKLFHDDVWLPLSPVDIFPLESKQNFPAVFTSKLMIEFVKPLESKELKTENNQAGEIPGVWQPASVEVAGTRVFASKAPYDVKLSIADEEPFFSHQGILPTEVSVPETDLKEAVNRFLDETGKTDVPLTITAGTEAPIKVNFDEAETVRVARNFECLDRDGRIKLSRNSEDVAYVVVGENKEVREVEFTAELFAGSERVLIAPVSTNVSTAHLCDLDHAAAQCFEPLPEGHELTSLELYLRPTKPPVIARLDLYADNLMQPAQQPLPAAGCEINIEQPCKRPWLPSWVPFSLPRPAGLNEGPWWAVLTVEAGEVHWFLSDIVPDGISRAMYRIAGGPWLQRRLYGADPKPPWSLCRLVVTTQDPPQHDLLLRRHGTSIELEPDSRGLVRIDGSNLARINSEFACESEYLELVIKCNASGSVVISNPRIRFK